MYEGQATKQQLQHLIYMLHAITKANKQDITFYELQIIMFWEFIHRIKT